MREIFDAKTAMVMLATVTSYGVQLSNASDTVKLVTGIGACVFVWLKVVRLWRSGRKR